jgi:hypothetical protein
MRLTDEQVEALRQRCDEAERALKEATLVTGEMGIELSALKARVERLTKERDEARKWERLHEVELNRTMLVLGHRFTLVPPDGGDVRPREAAKSAIDALAAAEARVAELEGALRQADEWFRAYAQGHYAKGDWDKAKRNHDRADYCNRAALGRDGT